MRILYGSGNILVSAISVGGAATQIIGFVQAMERAGHQIEMDISREQKVYPQIRSKKMAGVGPEKNTHQLAGVRNLTSAE